ncbi:MAG TPA: gluconokinase [Galbitalea sp.]|jgi:carbohydrate kinase (thermoresistant glucokinase family)|nr:gluconokinase [Galbitalea sp.]
MTTTPMQTRIVAMGVAGCGKTVVGTLLAAELGYRFVDADDLHPAANVAKMAGGTPLDDDDRWPWLDTVSSTLAESPGIVVACSALKRAHRDRLRASAGDITFVHLVGSQQLLARRMASRSEHFMPTSLLDSQLRTLEPLDASEQGAEVDVTPSPPILVKEILKTLGGVHG